MRKGLALLFCVAFGAIVVAQQARTEYLIDLRVLAGDPRDASSMQLVASPTFRLPEGQAGSLDLGDETGGVRLTATATGLGDGKVVLHVVTESRTHARVQASTFDVLAGMGVASVTVAPRDAGGSFLTSKTGQPIFVEFRSIAAKHRLR